MAYKLYNGNDWVDASFDPVNIPVSDDEVVIPHDVTGNKTDGADAAHELDLDLLMTHPGFTGDFGSSGAPIKSAADLIVHQGSGGFYFECTDDGSPNLTTDEVRIEAANNSVIAILGTDAAATLGDFATIVVARGNLTLDSSIVFTGAGLVKVTSIDNVGTDAILTIAAGAPTLPTLRQEGGTSTIHNVVTAFSMTAGTCLKWTAKVTSAIIHGGTFVYNHTALDADNTTIEVHAGATLDLMQNAVQKVIDKVIAHQGSEVLYDKNMHTITDFDDRRTRVA